MDSIREFAWDPSGRVPRRVLRMRTSYLTVTKGLVPPCHRREKSENWGSNISLEVPAWRQLPHVDATLAHVASAATRPTNEPTFSSGCAVAPTAA